jgi:hypothetical protein
MSFITKVVSHAVHLGKHLGGALAEAGKKHLARVKEHLGHAREYLHNIEGQTGLDMSEFHGHINRAEEAVNKTPPDWDNVKREVGDALAKFAKKL